MKRKIIYLFVLVLFTSGCSIDKGTGNGKHSADKGNSSTTFTEINSVQHVQKSNLTPGSVHPVQKSNLTHGVAKTRIIKRQTTQNIILEVFGEANIITKNKRGNKVWTYNKVSVETANLSEDGTVFIVGGVGSKASTSTSIFNLMIEFDDKNIVKDFSYKAASL